MKFGSETKEKKEFEEESVEKQDKNDDDELIDADLVALVKKSKKKKVN